MMIKQVSGYQDLVEYIFKVGGIVVADFHNTWSEPCKIIAPHLNQFRSEFQVAVAKIDVEKAEELASKFDIHAIPTYILLRRSGGEIATIDLVVSAHVEKLRKLFENAANMNASKS